MHLFNNQNEICGHRAEMPTEVKLARYITKCPTVVCSGAPVKHRSLVRSATASPPSTCTESMESISAMSDAKLGTVISF